MKFDHNFLQSLLHNRDMSWQIAVTELIDNALDANATGIAMAWRGKQFGVKDNGCGVSPEGFEAMYTLGGHARAPVRHGSRPIGRYGIGFKEAAGWMWGVTTIISSHEGRRRKLVIDWAHEVTKAEHHEILSPVHGLPGRPGPSFTHIICSKIQRNMPGSDLFQRLVSQLQHIYRPALESGLSVSFLRGTEQQTLMPTPWPLRAPEGPEVEGRITVAHRPVDIRAYLTADDVEWPGIHIASLGRVMDKVPMRYHSRNVYGWVHLGPEWELGKNKTAITDAHRDELMNAITLFCAPVIEAAERRAQALVLAELELAVEHLLRDGLAGVLTRPALMVGKLPAEPKGETDTPVETPTPTEPHPDRIPSANVSYIEDPTEKWLDDSTAPKIEVNVAVTIQGHLIDLEISDQTWTVVIDRDHRFITDFIQERCLGARGSDPMRLVHAMIDTIAAAAVTDERVSAAMPWLEGVAASERYTVALTRLWDGFLKNRRAGQEFEES